MQIRDAMTTDVQIAAPTQPISEAARIMAECDAGFVPIGENDRLVGMITDRDIAVRAVAFGKSPETPIREIMSKEVHYCFDDDEVDDVAEKMSDLKIRRMPVLNREKRLVGVVSLGDIALADGPENVGDALCAISEPGGLHSQSDGSGMRV